jgi:drug/metabolite transporter (DMT)-like permease
LQPLFAITTARIFLKEKMAKGYAVWAILALVAAYFVTFKNGAINFHTGAQTIMAALLAVGAAFAWGTSTTFSKIALKDKPSEYITGLRFFFTIIFAFIGVILFGKFSTIPTLTNMEAWTLIGIALTSGMVSLLIYYRGLKTTPVSVSTILELFYPLVAVFIGIFLYHDTLAASQYVAAAVLLYAMYRVGKTKKIDANAIQNQNS